MYSNTLLQDKVALITGGRSGIGFGIAKLFLSLGAKVIISSRKDAPLQLAKEQLSLIGYCSAKACDIRKTEEIQALADFITETHGRLDILINNAGGQFPAPAELISENGWNSVIANNLNGTFFMSQTMARQFFIPQSSGVMVNIIANMYRGFPGMAHTGAARAGVENLTKTLAQEWAEYNIRINAIAPGTIDSTGLDNYPPVVKDFLGSVVENNLMKRLGTVEDVSNAVVFMASPLSSYISGTTLYVDGMEHLSADRMGLYKTLKKLL